MKEITDDKGFKIWDVVISQTSLDVTRLLNERVDYYVGEILIDSFYPFTVRIRSCLKAIIKKELN
jgi:hypothetical protein